MYTSPMPSMLINLPDIGYYQINNNEVATIYICNAIFLQYTYLGHLIGMYDIGGGTGIYSG